MGGCCAKDSDDYGSEQQFFESPKLESPYAEGRQNLGNDDESIFTTKVCKLKSHNETVEVNFIKL